MAKKDRQKRSARKERQRQRAQLEAAHAASGIEPKQSDTKAVAKKSEASASKKPKTKKNGKKPIRQRIRDYFRDVRSEMHQVVWPSKSELRNYTLAVVAMLIVFGVCVWLVDTGFVRGLVALTSLRG